MNLKIGYREGDAAWALAEDEGGVRFLGLAAVLLASCSSIFLAATTLQDLLKRSASKSQPLPTLRQLQALLKALEYKLSPALFYDHVCKWSTLLYDTLAKHGQTTTSATHSFPDSQSELIAILRPDLPNETSGEWADIIDCLAQLERLGEADFVEVRLSNPSMVGWLIAFVKWCTGLPPTVRIGSVTIVDQPRTRILVSVESRAAPYDYNHKRREYIIYRTVENLREILYRSPTYSHTSTSANRPGGLVTVSSRLNGCLRHACLKTGHETGYVLGVLRYLAAHVVDRLAVKFGKPSVEVFFSAEILGKNRPKPFPNSDSILDFITAVFGVYGTFPEEKIAAVPDSENFGATIRRDIAGILVEVLMVSLLCEENDPETCSVYPYMFDLQTEKTATKILASACSVVAAGVSKNDSLMIPYDSVRNHLNGLLGISHIETASSSPHYYIISVSRGQVCIPVQLHDWCIPLRKSLAWKTFPGTLIFEGESYDRAFSVHRGILKSLYICSTELLAPEPGTNYWQSSFEPQIRVNIEEFGLRISAHMTANCDTVPSAILSLSDMVLGAQFALTLKQCYEPCSNPAEWQDRLKVCRTWEEADIKPPSDPSGLSLFLLPFHGRPDQQMFAVGVLHSSIWRYRIGFLHTTSCLSCLCSFALSTLETARNMKASTSSSDNHALYIEDLDSAIIIC